MRIYILRHCESAVMRWRMQNPDAQIVVGEYLPDSAVPISNLGEEQREALSLYFAALPESERPTHGFSSPFTRTVQTGEGALSRLPSPVVLIADERLREIEFGIFAELTKKGRAAKFPAQWEERRKVGKVNYRPEGGENWHDIAERFLSFQKECIDCLPDDAVVLIATHENVVSISQWKWGGGDVNVLAREGVPSASITTYDYTGGKFTLLSKNVLPPSPTGKDLFSMEDKEKDLPVVV